MTKRTGRIPLRERALLVGVIRSASDRFVAEEHVEELARLTDTAGGLVVSRVVKERTRPDPATLIGRGQAEDVARLVRTAAADIVIFDEDLSPAQMRNLEKVVEARILDRSGLILDIFARRARTHEARTQVELAQLQYFLPRLTRRWSHLERQEGRIGTRGVGETQLELDRRIIKSRIGKLRRDLRGIEGQRRQRRAARDALFRVALVGYTNAGKSTLMNRLTGADVFIEDRLFATLDATVRRIPARRLPGIVLIDTVGFIRKLPHPLVASFRSTLEEVREADLILHVVDASHPGFEDQAKTTREVLAEIGAAERPALTVWNKIDRLSPEERAALALLDPDAVAVSALTREGVPHLLARIRAVRERMFEVRSLDVPQARGDLLARVRADFEVLEESYSDGLVRFTLRGRRAELERTRARAAEARA